MLMLPANSKNSNLWCQSPIPNFISDVTSPSPPSLFDLLLQIQNHLDLVLDLTYWKPVTQQVFLLPAGEAVYVWGDFWAFRCFWTSLLVPPDLELLSTIILMRWLLHVCVWSTWLQSALIWTAGGNPDRETWLSSSPRQLLHACLKFVWKSSRVKSCVCRVSALQKREGEDVDRVWSLQSPGDVERSCQLAESCRRRKRRRHSSALTPSLSVGAAVK